MSKGREPLDPPEQAHVIDLDAPFGEELLKIPVGQSVSQVPTDGDQMTSGGNLNPANADLAAGRVERGIGASLL
jgi:hypothetical protein